MFNNLQELRDYFASIPEEKWCRDITINESQRCAIGWVRHAFHEQRGLAREWLIAIMGFTAAGELPNVNDGYFYKDFTEPPKTAVLRYIDGLIAGKQQIIQGALEKELV
jgi:hypothetical protein